MPSTSPHESRFAHKPFHSRQFLLLSDNFRVADDYGKTYGRSVIRGDLWKAFYSDMAHVSLEGSTQFENGKKPLRLIQNFIKWANNDPEMLILDFFAGSGTTADAVMRLNREDQGRRRYILVQINEEMDQRAAARRQGFHSVPQVAASRLRSSGEVIRQELGQIDVGFRFLRVDTSNMADVLRIPGDTRQGELVGLASSVKEGRTPEDLLFQVLLDWGLDVALPIALENIEGHEVYVVDEGAVMACFDPGVEPDVVRAMARYEPLRAVFLDSAFASDDARINVEQIFREISPGTDVRAV